MPITYAATQELLDGLAADVRLIFETEWTEPLPSLFERYADVVPNADVARIWHSIVGMGMPSRTGELELPRQDSPQSGRRHRGVATTYQLAVQYSLAAKGSPLGSQIIQRTAGMVRKGFKELKEFQMADIWLRGFTAPASGGVGAPDNVALFSTAHTTVRGSKTWANAPSATTTLSYTGLSLARAMRHRRYDDTGYRITGRDWNRLIILPDNEQLAFELTRSEKRPGQIAGGHQPNDMNWHYNTFVPEVWPYADAGPYPNVWWLSEAVGKDYGIKMLDVADVQTRSENNVGRKAVTEYYEARWYYMVDHAYSVWGSTGA